MDRGALMVRVGFLTYGLDRPLSGVGRVALELGRALSARNDCEVTFLTPYRRGPFVGERGIRSVYLPGCRLLPGLMAIGGPLIALVARRLDLDVVHDPIGIVPFTVGRWAGRYRRVASIHDAIAFEYPEGYPPINNLLHRVYVPRTLANVDRVATCSEHSRQSLARHYHLDADRIAVIGYGVSPHFAPVNDEHARTVAARHGLSGRYVLYVGAFQARKNVLGLLDAFARVRIRTPDVRLALVGPTQWEYPAMRARLAQVDVASGVDMIGYVPESDLPAIYSAATVAVLPSLYEGFGLPVLEAMACGTPVVCSTASSLPEVAGDAALLVDPQDSSAIGEAISRVVADPALAADLCARGLQRAADFTWEAAAESYARLYHDQVSR